VPTVPLVEQQRKKISEYLGARYIIKGFSGGDNKNLKDRRNEILGSHVIVITPQMFYNLLTALSKSQRLYVSDFTLLVLDECHHCTMKHPYEVVMSLVRDYYEKSHRADKPQVIGLTASLGTDKRLYDPEQTEKKILRLCVRMLAKQISSVRSKENLEELHRHVNLPNDEIIRVRRPQTEEFRRAISQSVDELVKKIEPIVERVKQKVDRLVGYLLDSKTSNFPGWIQIREKRRA
jgi:ERCC4-related helicase